jgi:CheY-like chemotaxis protein
VKDSGIGIAAEMLPHVFEIFSQAEPALVRAQGGLGIGLSLVKGMVELHNGNIEVRSGGLGRGSEFLVRLPIAGPPLVRESAPPREEPEHEVTAKRRVLIVDDNRDSAASMAKLLRVMGHEVDTAHDGEQAVEMAGAMRPEVVLLDIGLPKMNGYAAANTIRQQPWGKKMILIAVTGWGQEEDKRKSKEAGFDQHMVKPIDVRSLMKFLSELETARN